MGGKALGRPPKKITENAVRLQREWKQRVLDSREQVSIEGKLVKAKMDGPLNHIRAMLQKTSETWIKSILLLMILIVLLREKYEKRNFS